MVGERESLLEKGKWKCVFFISLLLSRQVLMSAGTSGRPRPSFVRCYPFLMTFLPRLAWRCAAPRQRNLFSYIYVLCPSHLFVSSPYVLCPSHPSVYFFFFTRNSDIIKSLQCFVKHYPSLLFSRSSSQIFTFIITPLYYYNLFYPFCCSVCYSNQTEKECERHSL